MRHEAKARLNPQGKKSAACCACATGESPVPVGVGAPGSWPQVLEADLCARAGRQEPVKQRELYSGEQARGPQHVQGHERNVRGPSAWPLSGQARSYRPKAKSSRAQRESEGIVVLHGVAQAASTKAVGHDAAGGKGPCGGHAEIAGKRKGMAGKNVPNDPGGEGREFEPSDEVRQLRRQLWAAAKRAPARHLHVKYPTRGSDALRVACGQVRQPAPPLLAREGPRNAASRRPPESRVREIRMHGLRGGLGSEVGLRAKPVGAKVYQ